jgi:hypothetical protein
MVAAATTLGLVGIMGVQSVMDNLQPASSGEGISALDSTSQAQQFQFTGDDGHTFTVVVDPRLQRRNAFTLRPAVPSSRVLGSSHGS